MNLIPIGTSCYHAGDFLSSTEVIVVNEEIRKLCQHFGINCILLIRLKQIM